MGADPADQLQRQLRRQDAGIFYPCLPDLPIARVMFLAGIAVAALGLPACPPGRAGRGCGAPPRWSPRRGGGRRDRRRAGHHRPALGARHGHPGPARRRQRPADPVHPGLRPRRRDPGLPESGLRPLAARRDAPRWRPVLAESAGLPGAPARATQVATVYPQRSRARPAPAADARRPPAGAPHAARRARPAGTVRLLRLGRTASSSLDADRLLSVHAFVGAGTRLRQPGAAGRPGGAAARRRDSVRRAAQGCVRLALAIRCRDRRATRLATAAGPRRGPAVRRRCPPPPGTPGSPLTWPRCGPASSPSGQLP